ncbi:MAG: hypothetical protein H8E44_13175 [Planctomycetes bacterium]|nr:hypothetical protein [Planctomycetota bacterium]MBL7040213.1 hypothetical protein [Pirellulaceae bacterium]
MPKKTSTGLLAVVVIVYSMSMGMLHASEGVAIRYDQSDPKVEFAAGDLRKAIADVGCRVVESQADRTIVFDTFSLGMGPQSFRIRREGENVIRVVGGDSLGAMYGGLELAEMIALGGGLDAVVEKARKPYISRRGLKFNIPFDGRAPSYDDTGTAAHENIAVMWEWEFWEAFLDSLARDRYNTLTLWTNHPYPGIVDLKEYPGVSYDNVCRLRERVDTSTDRHFDDTDLMDPANVEVIKEISLDDKIAFWNRVFDHADARGIDIIVFHWNIYIFGAKGKHGITDDMNNPKTIPYMRYCIGEFLKTYPQVDGIGITAGEHMRGQKTSALEKEQWLWQTYGQGVMDAKAADPDRELRIIFRQHQANLSKIVDAFKEFDGPFNTGHKYARARLYSTSTSPYLDIEYRGDLEQNRVPCWLNLRNDDLFVLRWGDADYVREFLQNVPRDLMRYEAGFYMGPDGFVFGREFISRDPELSGQLEIDKHWYRFMLWGRLGYDLTLTRDYFERRLTKRFPKTDAALVYDTWQAASQIVPQVNRFFFRVNDFQFSPEGCIYNRGFLSLDQFFEHPPLNGSGILSVQDYAAAVLADKPFDGITPMEVADRLDALAERSLEGVEKLEVSGETSNELAATLIDIRAMAHLGRYYADKIRGAAQVAVFRADSSKAEHKQRAAQYLTEAVQDWEAYAKVASSAYRPQLYSRTHYLDWWKIRDDVRNEVEVIRNEKAAD